MGVGFFLIGQDSDPERVGSLQEVPPSPTSRAQRLLNVRRVLIGSTIAVVGLVVVAVSRQVGQASAEVELSSVVGLSKEIADGEEKTTKKAECRDTEFGDKCWTAASWAKSDGIYAHPEWYPDLTPQSSIFKFQAIVHKFSPKHCPNAPCSKGDDHPQTHQASPPAATAPPHPQPTAAPPPQPAAAPVAKPQEKPVQIKYLETKVNCSSPLVPVSSKSPTGQLTMTCGCPPPQVLDKSGGAPRCLDPAGPSQMTFYMYRAQSDDEYLPENVNAADLAGLMWYLHNEVVPSVPRKFGVTRILRYMVTMQNTQEFYGTYPKQFGPFVAFDSAKCTAPHCDSIWKKYGFVIGCQNLDRYVANYVRDFKKPQEKPEQAEILIRKLRGKDRKAEDEENQEPHKKRSSDGHGSEHDQQREHSREVSTRTSTDTTTTTVFTTITQTHIHDSFHSGIWYSLPGGCPNSTLGDKSDACLASMPGGHCNVVNGEKDCTYNAEYAGEIRLDDLSGILDEKNGIRTYDDWWKNAYIWCMGAVARGERKGPCKHNVEYSVLTDEGVGTDFWNGKHDMEQGLRRMNRVRQLFREKYPHLPDTFEEPACL
eukprot:CAMPEP_0115210618 /NCGR_PEP_ID=MMETSP0270-20121206/22340_1 /TAXON_ID=71861 /ORGANISM="Scrippsiella trochoidea, Strain CCMP3099" /LENGTH=594 /DNA_ID=CAMNT_0002624279 /DNA_START=60 /DNA_END=1844 /DNA_ORIENTATION=+